MKSTDDFRKPMWSPFQWCIYLCYPLMNGFWVMAICIFTCCNLGGEWIYGRTDVCHFTLAIFVSQKLFLSLKVRTSQISPEFVSIRTIILAYNWVLLGNLTQEFIQGLKLGPKIYCKLQSNPRSLFSSRKSILKKDTSRSPLYRRSPSGCNYSKSSDPPLNSL